MRGSDTEMAQQLADLVAAARGGDREAFDELVRRTHTETYSLARRLTGNEEDARDVTQEAYLRAYKGLKRFRGDAAFTTWMYRITANAANTHMGKGRKHRHDELDADLDVIETDASLDPQGRLDAVELRHRLGTALDELSDTHRQIIVLRDVYGLSHTAIAAELGISETNAKVRLHRARAALKKRLFPGRGEKSHVSAV